MTLLASSAFFLSGFAALLYQVSWQRMLVIFSGADVYSATLIVAAFMGGLGVGNLAGGHVADRTSARASLVLFATAELAIAVFGLFSTSLYYDYLYQQLGHFDIAPAVMGGILFVSLLWPTFFMGASLPLLARTLAQRVDRAASVIGVLYGVNTLGAAAGAVLSTWWLLPRLGLEGGVRVAALLNIICAAVLLPLAVMMRRSPARPPESSANDAAETRSPDAPTGPAFSFWMWAAIFGLSGMLALSLEIIWFRLLGVMMKSTAFTFGTLLALYLAGLGLGALAGSVMAPRVRSPSIAFLSLQAAAAVGACVLLTLFLRGVDNFPLMWAYLGSYEPMSVREQVAQLQAAFSGSSNAPVPTVFIIMYVGVPAALIVPSTLLMGCSFPMLQRVVQTDLRRVGRRVGVLLFANVVGSMLGAAITGWLLLDLFGTAGTLRLVAFASGLFAVLAVALLGRDARWRGRHVLAAAGASGLVYASVMVGMPDTMTLWTRLHGALPDRVIFGEDGSGVSVVKTQPTNAIVFVNGVGQSVIPYGDVHTALGALPAFIHPAPKAAAIIGLGSGDTVHAVAGRRDLETIACVEIIKSQILTLRALDAVWPYEGLKHLLADSRVRHLAGDGRIHLMRGGAQYDIIEADALRPSSAYSGNLYSEAYFMLVRDSLKPNGLAATWAPTARVYNAFLRVFPYVVSVPGILIGSRSPIDLDRDAIAARLAASDARGYYAAAGIDIERMFAEYLTEPARYGPEFSRESLADFNTDLFPKDEFDLSPPAK
jgi:predicted membrane-bound spermidine synthase